MPAGTAIGARGVTDWAAEDLEYLGGSYAAVDAETRERRVRFFFEQERAKREARRRLDAEGNDTTLPAFDTLRARLAVPRMPTAARITGWQRQRSRVMLAAQFKAGKTTLVGNMIRSLVDGDPFLGRDNVAPIDGTLVLLDDEMGADLTDDWLSAQQIHHDDRVVPVSLRGRAASFNIIDDTVRGEWAGRLKQHGCAYLVLDNLRPMFDALGLDEHHDAGRFLVAFDALLTEAGIPEALVVHHMGHTGERSRGDSRLRDWPDVEWKLVRRDENPASPRFISAYGRDVDVPESQLDFTLEGRRLTIAGGSRQDMLTTEALDAVLSALEASGQPLSTRGIECAVAQKTTAHSRAIVRAAITVGIRTGRITTEYGPKNAILHSVRQCAEVRRECASAQVSTSAPVRRDLYSPARTRTDSDGPLTADGKPFHFDGRPT
jgi:hypothetical protein